MTRRTKTWKRTPVVHRFALLTAVALVTAAMAGCGTDEADTDTEATAETEDAPDAAEAPATEEDGEEDGGEVPADSDESEEVSDEPEQLTLAISTGSTNYGPVWTALAANLFEENGLELEVLTGTGPGTQALLSSGQADVAMFTISFPLQVAIQGLDTSVIYTNGRNAIPPLATHSSITSIEELQDLDECRLASSERGTSFYAAAIHVMEYLDLDCEHIGVSDPGALGNGLASGQYDAAVHASAVIASPVAAGEANLLIDPQQADPELVEGLNAFQYPALVTFGLTENLEDKREAVTRFIRALYQGGQIIGDESAEDIADLILTEAPELFPGQTIEPFTVAWIDSKEAVPTDDERGYIPEELWPEVLDYVHGFGLDDFDPDNPDLNYHDRVDMSYWYDATGR